VVKKLRESAQKLYHSRTASDAAHRELQLHASVSQKLHEEMIDFSKKANVIKTKLRPIELERRQIIQKSNGMTKQLREKISELGAVTTDLDKIKVEEEKQRKIREEEDIAKKEKT